MEEVLKPTKYDIILRISCYPASHTAVGGLYHRVTLVAPPPVFKVVSGCYSKMTVILEQYYGLRLYASLQET